MKFSKLFASICVSAGLAFALSGCGDNDGAKNEAAAGGVKTIVVGVSPVPHADIVQQAAAKLKAQGVEVKIVEFSDYIQPNISLADKELDANFFQHKPYLDEFASSHKLSLVPLASVHLEPMGVYSRKVKDLKDLAEGAKVAVPNDPVNSARALKVLEAAGLIKINEKADVLASPNDIVENPKKLEIIEVEAAQLPRSLDDVAAAVINSNYALGAGLNPLSDALAVESKDSPYANIVAVRAGDETREELVKLKEALNSEETKKYILDQYKGSILPAF